MFVLRLRYFDGNFYSLALMDYHGKSTTKKTCEFEVSSYWAAESTRKWHRGNGCIKDAQSKTKPGLPELLHHCSVDKLQLYENNIRVGIIVTTNINVRSDVVAVQIIKRVV